MLKMFDVGAFLDLERSSSSVWCSAMLCDTAMRILLAFSAPSDCAVPAPAQTAPVHRHLSKSTEEPCTVGNYANQPASERFDAA